jgi:RNA polymerase sigma-70 factor (ECF subfamily)
LNARNNTERFEDLVETHKGILYKVCRLYCPRPESREDLAQEILIQLWRAFGRYDGARPFSTWMYRIALNVAVSYYRGESARSRPLVEGEQALVELRAPEREEPAEVRALYAFIATLDPLNRALVLLHLDGHSYEETAEALGLSTTNVATKLSRLKARMREELGARREA